MAEANTEALRRGYEALNRDDLIAVVHQSGRGRASGVAIEIRIAHVWTVADGRAIRWEAVPDPDEAVGDNPAR